MVREMVLFLGNTDSHEGEENRGGRRSRITSSPASVVIGSGPAERRSNRFSRGLRSARSTRTRGCGTRKRNSFADRGSSFGRGQMKSRHIVPLLLFGCVASLCLGVGSASWAQNAELVQRAARGDAKAQYYLGLALVATNLRSAEPARAQG